LQHGKSAHHLPSFSYSYKRSFFIFSNGLATNLALGQAFCSNLANNTALVGFYQGAYGIGGITGPLIATALVSHGSKWSRFYIILLLLAFLNLLFSTWAFHNYEQENPESADSDALPPPSPITTQPRHPVSRTIHRNWASFKTLLSNRTNVLGALFIFAYQGAEDVGAV
jgi:MFS family permease